MVCLSETYLFNIENYVKAYFDDKTYHRIHIRLLEYVEVDERAGSKGGVHGLCPWSQPMSKGCGEQQCIPSDRLREAFLESRSLISWKRDKLLFVVNTGHTVDAAEAVQQTVLSVGGAV